MISLYQYTPAPAGSVMGMSPGGQWICAGDALPGLRPWVELAPHGTNDMDHEQYVGHRKKNMFFRIWMDMIWYDMIWYDMMNKDFSHHFLWICYLDKMNWYRGTEFRAATTRTACLKSPSHAQPHTLWQNFPGIVPKLLLVDFMRFQGFEVWPCFNPHHQYLKLMSSAADQECWAGLVQRLSPSRAPRFQHSTHDQNMWVPHVLL